MLFTSLLFFYFLLPTSADAATIGRPANNLGLVGYWNFDIGKEGATTVYDASGMGNTGTLTNAAGSANWIDGKIGQGMIFAGDNDFVELGSDSSLDLGTELSVSAWFKTSNSSNQSFYTAKLNTASTLHIRVHGSTDKLEARTDTSASWQDFPRVRGATTVTDGEWHHMLYVQSNSGQTLTLYLDGVSDATATGDVVGAFSPTSNRIGEGGGQYFNGPMDDFRVYNRALSAQEAKRLYNLGVAGGQKFNATPTLIADGLIGHWTFDGSNVATTIADSSGQGNNGFFENGATSSSLVIGKTGQALEFDGVNEYVQVPDDATFDLASGFSLTVMAWVRTSASYDCGTASNNKVAVGYRVGTPQWWVGCDQTTDMVRWSVRGSGGEINEIVGTSLINDGQWHHIVGLYNKAINKTIIYVDGILETSDDLTITGDLSGTSAVCIGAYGTVCTGFTDADWDGEIDDVRMYNRALSALEIKQIYNATGGSNFNTSAGGGSLSNGLIGHWTFDGNDVGTSSVTDVTGNGHIGTTTGTITRKIGKIGQAFEFDSATFSYVDIADHADFTGTEFSGAAWVYAKQINAGDQQGIFAQTDQDAVPDDERKWFLRVETDGTLAFWVTRATCAFGGYADVVSASSVPINEWFHVLFTVESNTLILYYNGIEIDTDSILSTCSDVNPALRIGARQATTDGADESDLRIDDVRYYNRALTPQEVTRLYNMGI